MADNTTKRKVPRGYKESTIGPIPKEWEVKHLGECCKGKLQYGANASSIDYDPSLPRYIRITDITEDGNLLQSDRKSIPIEKANGTLLNEGDFLFARTGATVGKTYLHCLSAEVHAFAGYLIRFVPDRKILLSEYLKFFTETQRYWNWVKNTTRAGAQPNINGQEYSSLKIPCPPIHEQKSIVSVLSLWQDNTNKLRQLILAKRKFKRALMQQLLTGNRRFKEPGEQKWETVTLRDFLIPKIRPIPKPSIAFMALGIRSFGKGTFQKPNFEPNDIALQELYQVKKSDLIVNITFAWEGAITIVKESDDGALVSHRFPTYEFNREVVIPEYFRYVILQKRFVHELGLVSPGGAGRNRVLSKTNFLKIKVTIPPLKEQYKIGNLLNSLDREINLLGQHLELLKQQKRGLMQKLLTGKIRVRILKNIKYKEKPC